MMLPVLNLPSFEMDVRGVADSSEIFDSIRRRFVRLTAEEWVRQHFIRYLVDHRGFPAPLVAVESGFVYRGMQRRVDILAYDRFAKPLLLVECKAPVVPVSQSTFDQIGRYNVVFKAPFLAVSNGLKHFCVQVDHKKGRYVFVDELPSFDEMIEAGGAR